MSDKPFASFSSEDTMTGASASDIGSTSAPTRISIHQPDKGKANERSDIWKEFKKEYKENGDIRAKCNHCKFTYKYIGSSTTNLWKHFEKHHKVHQEGTIDPYFSKVRFS